MFESSFDENGILYYLGTDGRKRPYVNPHNRHVLAARSSGWPQWTPSPEDFVGRGVKDSSTDHVANSWMSVDLGSTKSLQVNHYCLRHGDGTGWPIDERRGYWVLRHWHLQGSNDGLNWTTLREHINDSTMEDSAYSEGNWEVNSSASRTPFRYFRIIQTGENSNGYDTLVCCGIELYGTLKMPAGSLNGVMILLL